MCTQRVVPKPRHISAAHRRFLRAQSGRRRLNTAVAAAATVCAPNPHVDASLSLSSREGMKNVGASEFVGTSPLTSKSSTSSQTRTRVKYDRSMKVLSAAELQDRSRFPVDERVLLQRVSHSTTPERAKAITDEVLLRGNKSPDPRYDGRLGAADAPACVFTHVAPDTERAVLPFSWYPRAVPPGAPLAIVSLSMAPLAADEFAMFCVGTIANQFGEKFRSVYRSQVVFVHRDNHDGVEFCRQHLVPMDKTSNRVLFLDEHGDWRFATQYAFDSDGTTIKRQHQVHVTFVGDLPLSPEFDAQVTDAKRIDMRSGAIPCVVDDCDFTCHSLTVYRTHYVARHTELSPHRPFRCSFSGCSFSASYRSHLVIHERGHSGSKPFICPHDDCTYAAADSSSLKSHLKTHTGEVHRCSVSECSFEATRLSQLRSHQLSVHDMKPFPCTEPDCSYSAMQHSDLVRHQRIHSGEKPFLCPHEQCSYATAERSNLVKHQRIHAGSKPFQCDDCDFSSSSSSDLVRHQRTHSGMKPFRCAEFNCSYASTQKSNLARHMRTQHGGPR